MSAPWENASADRGLRTALRAAWRSRDELGLPVPDRADVLAAIITHGCPAEAEAAAVLLHALRTAEAAQANFDRMLEERR